MLSIEIPASSNPADRPFNVHYNISTPKEPEAANIDPSLPTLLFLHPLYYPSGVFHRQHNSSLRRFNLLTMQFRHHGSTKGEVWEGIRLEDLADDVFRFLTVLRLPPVHVCGLSLGASVALRLSIQHPSRVKSVVLISIFSQVELPNIAAGRIEIQETYVEAIETGDLTAHQHAAAGNVQLAFGDAHESADMARRILKYYALPEALASWHDTATCTAIGHLGLDGVLNRTVIIRSDLEKITAPVLIIHGELDLAYPISVATDLERDMQEAGLKAQIYLVDAPHFCSVHAAKEVNSRLVSWVLSLTPDGASSCLVPTNPISPWQDGLFPEGDEAEEEDHDH